MDMFRAENPDVKFLFVIHSRYYLTADGVINESVPSISDEVEALGVTVVNWGRMVYDIVNGRVTVPGGKETYNKNSFIISKSASDGYHPNLLTGYITALMVHSAITGADTVGQDYSFCGNTAVNKAFDFTRYVKNYYTYDGATTNFPEIFASPEDMRGIQMLAGEYLNN